MRKLHISTSPSCGMFEEPYISAAEYEEAVERTSAALAATMPGVRRLSFGGFGRTTTAIRRLHGRLADLYSDQLQLLGNWRPIAVPPGCVLKHLRCMYIGYKDGGGYQYPGVDPAKLVSLSVLLLLPDHSWALFGAAGDSGTIEFPNLRRLKVEYGSDDREENTVTRRLAWQSWRLHFPSLARLEIRCPQDVCPLLECAVFPPRVDDLFIEAAAPVLQRASELTLPAARRFKIRIMGRGRDDTPALPIANRILESAQGSEELVLDVQSTEVPVLPESITCTSLTQLSIMADTSVDTMLGLIRKHPSLTSLNLWELTLGDVQEDMSIPEPGGDRLIEPFDTNIKKLEPADDFEETGSGIPILVAKYLLLKIPTLVKLSTMWGLKAPLMEFVEEYSEQYPHLARISFLAL